MKTTTKHNPPLILYLFIIFYFIPDFHNKLQFIIINNNNSNSGAWEWKYVAIYLPFFMVIIYIHSRNENTHCILICLPCSRKVAQCSGWCRHLFFPCASIIMIIIFYYYCNYNFVTRWPYPERWLLQLEREKVEQARRHHNIHTPHLYYACM